MRYLFLLFMLFVACNAFGQDKITNSAIHSYLKSAEKFVVKKDIDALMSTVADEADFTMYEEHNGEMKHYHFDKNSYKKMMQDSFKTYSNMKKYKIVNVKPKISGDKQSAIITYDIQSSILINGVVKDYLTKSTEKIILRNGKIFLVNYESIMKY
jgi:hypothetical protein